MKATLGTVGNQLLGDLGMQEHLRYRLWVGNQERMVMGVVVLIHLEQQLGQQQIQWQWLA
jgi:hypothetical protein